ncbi:DUF3224 domain-containing protein [Lentzea sp. BCCO 10_0798]|uniref:DUF3224 domain-containing protein n=1 Tax=Lentzea kristufekii TaxID=3095430 RepID=A0ABU4TYS0_9PSEU|nr:DUF3224 domain-containing protein [Lentzea sp. BCCO 10_0798]MDX8053233.1 DUF3224 domain-containing protein [Lentzea sp. BCCO 10_0798]
MKATGTIDVKSWDEKTWDGRAYQEVEGRKLTEAHVQFTYAGDVSGVGSCRYLMYYGDDVAWTTAIEEITTDEGTLVLRHVGAYRSSVEAAIEIVDGTGKYLNARGAVTVDWAEDGSGTYTLEYEV